MQPLCVSDPEPPDPVACAVHLLVPLAILAIHLTILFLLLPYRQFVLVLGLMVAYILPPAGKETVIPAGIALGVPWWLMAGAVALIDIETGLFMVYNFDLAYRVPVLGPWLEGFTQAGKEYILRRQWLSKLYFAGIVFLVMVPFFGSGGIRGSVIGRLLGMDRRMVFLAIAAGAVLGCTLIALLSSATIAVLCENGVYPC